MVRNRTFEVVTELCSCSAPCISYCDHFLLSLSQDSRSNWHMLQRCVQGRAVLSTHQGIPGWTAWEDLGSVSVSDFPGASYLRCDQTLGIRAITAAYCQYAQHRVLSRLLETASSSLQTVFTIGVPPRKASSWRARICGLGCGQVRALSTGESALLQI